MQPELCNEMNEKTDRISYIVHKTSNFCSAKSNYDTGIASKKQILLSQEPKETINLEFSFSHGYYQNSKVSGYRVNWDFKLYFYNNLHDVSNDYGYEIDFYLHVNNSDASPHTLLCSRKEIRKTKMISQGESKNYASNEQKPAFLEELIMESKGRHICCNIRRYNIKNAKHLDLRSTQNINVGAILFENGLYSDTLLSVGKEHFHVHKDILSSASDVFKAMFSHDMLENEKGKIIIEDFDPEIVKELLSFIYTSKTSLLYKMPLELYQIAHKYGIHSLEEQCKEYFLFGVNDENIVSMLDTANTYELTDLKANLMNYVYKHGGSLVYGESFRQFLLRDLKIDNVVYILQLCEKNKHLEKLKGLKTKAFEIVKKNNETLSNNADFLKLFELHPSLMKELYVFTHKKD